MNFIIEYWPVFVVAIAVLGVAGYAIYAFIKRPTSEQLNKVREWLLFAVSQSEKELGSGTGQIKLRYVYDMFLLKFPFLVRVVPFEQFSLLVDEALDKFRVMLTDNKAVKEYVNPAPTKVVVEAVNKPAETETN